MANLEIRAQAVSPYDNSTGLRFSAYESYGWENLNPQAFTFISGKLVDAEAAYRKIAGKKSGGDIKLVLSMKVDGQTQKDVEIPGFTRKDLQDVHKAWQKIRQEVIDWGDKQV